MSPDVVGNATEPPALSLLVVCRANRFRSPLAEHLLAAALTSAGVEAIVRSAGTHAADGEPLDPLVRDLLAHRGISAAPQWRSTMLTPDELQRADVILTSDHRRSADVTRMRPAALRTVFTLRRFGRFMVAVREQPAQPPGPDGPRPLPVAARIAVDSLRGQLPPTRPDEDDLADPIRHVSSLLPRCATEIARLAESIAGGLGHLAHR